MIEFFGPDGYRRSVYRQQRYSDNTPLIKLDGYDTLLEKANGVAIPDADIDTLFNALALCAGIRENGGAIYNLVLPYLPGARQDRVNPTGDVLATASLVNEMINLFGFNVVLTADVHSRKSVENLNNHVMFPMAKIYEQLPGGFDAIIAPDRGGKERAELAGRVMGRPVIFAEKHRDVSTGALSGFAVDVKPDGHYLIVDDICDGGGTFLGLVEKIHEQHATASLFVTHGIFSKGTEELKKKFTRVYTTDSRASHGRIGLEILPIVERMIDYV